MKSAAYSNGCLLTPLLFDARIIAACTCRSTSGIVDERVDVILTAPSRAEQLTTPIELARSSSCRHPLASRTLGGTFVGCRARGGLDISSLLGSERCNLRLMPLLVLFGSDDANEVFSSHLISATKRIHCTVLNLAMADDAGFELATRRHSVQILSAVPTF